MDRIASPTLGNIQLARLQYLLKRLRPASFQGEKKPDCLYNQALIFGLKGKSGNDRFKVLDSLENHWEGLTVFVEHPQVPMDNNSAEQAFRMPIVGRRSFYGSGSVWSAELAAIVMGWIKTLLLWSLNPYTWMRTYLQACADNGLNS